MTGVAVSDGSKSDLIPLLVGCSVNRIILSLLSMCLFVCPAVAKSQSQSGLDYWNQINKEAIETDSGLKYKIRILGNLLPHDFGRGFFESDVQHHKFFHITLLLCALHARE